MYVECKGNQSFSHAHNQRVTFVASRERWRENVLWHYRPCYVSRLEEGCRMNCTVHVQLFSMFHKSQLMYMHFMYVEKSPVDITTYLLHVATTGENLLPKQACNYFSLFHVIHSQSLSAGEWKWYMKCICAPGIGMCSDGYNYSKNKFDVCAIYALLYIGHFPILLCCTSIRTRRIVSQLPLEGRK